MSLDIFGLGGLDIFGNIISGANGLDYNPGSDTDVDILTVGVTGTPKLYWDESQSTFRSNVGLIVDALSFIGDDANANMTLGLTVNQGANDDEILAFKSSDVSHGCTVKTETDTFGVLQKVDPDTGGLSIDGYRDTTNLGLILRGNTPATIDTTKSTAGRSVIEVHARAISGTSVAAPGANANLLGVRDGTTGITKLIVDQDGDLWIGATGKGITLASGTSGGADSAAVADEVSLGCYEISAGNRALAISQESAVQADTDETKFSNKLPVRINGATYYIMLTAT